MTEKPLYPIYSEIEKWLKKYEEIEKKETE